MPLFLWVNGMILFEKIVETAQIPKRQTEGAAGFDLHTTEDVIVPVGGSVLAPTGIRVGLPTATVGIIKDRSGEAYKHGIHVLAGVIDEDYRGEVKVVLHNLGEQARHYLAGDRVAQMVVVSYHQYAAEAQSLTGTDRGTEGFGSTGV